MKWSNRKWLLVAIGIPVLGALWWAFRPEKLWINQKVNEAAPFDASADPQPILTGRFAGSAPQTSGRATIYKKPGGASYLRLSDFTTETSADVHVLLARSETTQDSIDFGPVKSDPGDQSYDLPASADPNDYKAVLIYSERSHQVVGTAKLEPF
jgi:cbb3-type cytochrome oxidase subunit 3